MKTFNNLFGRNSIEKKISDFEFDSLDSSKMIAIKGGTEPILPDPSLPPVIKPNENI